jgi:hypothetical protein
MTSPLFTTSPLGELWQQSRAGVKVARTAERPAPEDWRTWLKELFPNAVSRPFAPHHELFWEHIWAIDDAMPRPFLGIWPREGGKSTNVELACVAIGVRGIRPYVLYVRATQEKADDSVGNIAAKLESESIDSHYPKHGTKLVGKFGSSKGWRRNRLRTAGGFTVDALGLDSAARGAKVEDDRPGVIVFDDIDNENDTPAITARKRKIITTAILPAGAQNVAVIGVQNLIIADGIFTQLQDGRADYLATRVVSGPHKAVKGLKTEWRDDASTGTKQAIIVAGEPTWEGQSLEVCQRQINLWGLDAFLREAQHEVKDRVEGLALNFDDAEHFIDLTHQQILELVKLGQTFGGIDFQAWRFGFTAWAADTAGRAIRIEEIFSQREELSVRAFRIHYACERLGIVRGDKLLQRFPIWGDSANPQDILELNAAWKRGWRDPTTGKHVTSPLRVVGVGNEAKLRRASVQRINTKLAERAVLFVRSVGADHRWLLGYNAGSAGTAMRGSRLMWEVRHWAYKIPAEGKVDLKQDPDDHTADGADMIASGRYALMSWWKPGKEQEDEELDAWAPETLAADADRSRTLKHRLKKPTLKLRRSVDDDEEE